MNYFCDAARYRAIRDDFTAENLAYIIRNAETALEFDAMVDSTLRQIIERRERLSKGCQSAPAQSELPLLGEGAHNGGIQTSGNGV